MEDHGPQEGEGLTWAAGGTPPLPGQREGEVGEGTEPEWRARN